MNKYVERLYNGIVKENPTFVLMLGMCPTLAVTTAARKPKQPCRRISNLFHEYLKTQRKWPHDRFIQ